MLHRILSIFLMLAIFFSDLIAMDDKPDENVMVLRSGRRAPKTTSANSSSQPQTSQVADDSEEQVRKRRRVEEKKEERGSAEMSPTIPPVARGYEDIYQRFLRGVLIYRPNGEGDDEGRVDLPIAALANPLEGTFDLSQCGDAGQSLSISTGYKKQYIPENAGTREVEGCPGLFKIYPGKAEVWICPRFLIERELKTMASHFKPIMGSWKQEAPIGLFWTDGAQEDLFQYDYLTKGFTILGNLYENWQEAWGAKPGTKIFRMALEEGTGRNGGADRVLQRGCGGVEELERFELVLITNPVNSSLQPQTSQVANDNEEQVRKGRCAEGKEEERGLVEMSHTISPVAQGYEAIYERFLNGVLIYRPNGDGNDAGRINLPIRDLGNPLEGTFDLSRCGDTEDYYLKNYLSISTGYRKGKKPENKNKLEIWFAPKFLIEKELNTTAAHFKPIMGKWKQDAPVGMFWTWGGSDNISYYDYLTTENMDNLSKINLYENWKKGRKPHHRVCDLEGLVAATGSRFQVSFLTAT